jgi:hypothetical protein
VANPVNQFLQLHYPGLKLRAPLFYLWPVGLRFDLQADFSASDDAYFQEVAYRAALLFEEIFQPDDPVLVVHQLWGGKRLRIRRTAYLLRQLMLPKSALVFQKIGNPYPQSFQLGRWNRVCATTTAGKIPQASILGAISNQHFPSRKPVIHGDTYLLNQRTGIVFHMYDDRGIDIIGPNAEILRPIYNRQAVLLLEYDRKKMDAVFAADSSSLAS